MFYRKLFVTYDKVIVLNFDNLQKQSNRFLKIYVFG